MTSTSVLRSNHRQPLSASSIPTTRWSARWGLFRDLQHPGQVLENITPNWYASIMGTGIVAVSAASLPLQFPGFRAFATLVWALAALLLVGLSVVTAVHWRQHRATARGICWIR